MPHWVLQYLLAWADHLFQPGAVFVYLERWNNPHILSLGHCKGLIHIHLDQILSIRINEGKQVLVNSCEPNWKSKYDYRDRINIFFPGVTLRKFKEGYLTHKESKNGDICKHCWFDATMKWITETPEKINFNQIFCKGLEFRRSDTGSGSANFKRLSNR